MKTKNFFLIILLITVLGMKLNFKKSSVAPLLLENVEALAAGEYDYAYYCFGAGSVDCSPIGKKVKDFTIGYRLGKYG